MDLADYAPPVGSVVLRMRSSTQGCPVHACSCESYLNQRARDAISGFWPTSSVEGYSVEPTLPSVWFGWQIMMLFGARSGQRRWSLEGIRMTE